MAADGSCDQLPPEGFSYSSKRLRPGGKNGPPSVRGVMGIWLRRFGSLSCCCWGKLLQPPSPSSPGTVVQWDFWTVPCPFTHFMLTPVPSCPCLCFLLPFPLCLLLAHQWPLAGEATLQKLEAAIGLFNSSSSPASGAGESNQGFSRLKGKRNSLEQSVDMRYPPLTAGEPQVVSLKVSISSWERTRLLGGSPLLVFKDKSLEKASACWLREAGMWDGSWQRPVPAPVGL